MDLCWQVMSLLLNMLSRLVITCLPRSKSLLISWLQSPSAVDLEPPKVKSAIVCTVSPSVCHEVMGPDAIIFIFWMLSFKPIFLLSSFTFIKTVVATIVVVTVLNDLSKIFLALWLDIMFRELFPWLFCFKYVIFTCNMVAWSCQTLYDTCRIP